MYDSDDSDCMIMMISGMILALGRAKRCANCSYVDL